MSSKETIRDVALPLAFVGVCLAIFGFVFFAPTLVDVGPQSVGVSYDFHSFFNPKFTFGTRELLSGRLPVWNRYEFGGIPFLATSQPSVLYPPKIIAFALLPSVPANLVYLFGHLILGAVGFALFLRDQGLRGLALFIGPAVFIFAAPLLVSSYHSARAANIAWTPIILLLVERLVRDPSRARFAALTLVVALQLVAGYPVFTVDLSLLVAVHAIARWATGGWKRPPWRTLPLIGGAFALAALIAAVQLFPLAELGVVTKRAELAASGDWREGLGAPPPHWLAITELLPTLTPFAYVALFDKRCRVAAAGLLTCIAMGSGGWELLKMVPGFSMVRFPWTWYFVLPFFVAWLAAVGAQSLLVPETRKPSIQKLQWWLLFLGCFAWATFCYVQLKQLAGGTPIAGDGWRLIGRRVPNALSALLGMAGAGVLALALIQFFRGRSPRWPLIGAVGLLLFAHLSAYPFMAPAAAMARPKPHGIVGGHRAELPPLDGRVFSAEDVAYGYTLTDRVEGLFGAEHSFQPVRIRPATERFQFAPMLRYIRYERLSAARGFLDMMNVQYVVAHASLAPIFDVDGLTPVRQYGDQIVFENPDRVGPAWVNHAVRVVPNQDAAARAVLSKRFRPRERAIVEQPLSKVYPAQLPRSIAYTKATAVRVVEPTHVEIDVNLERPGVLVLSESAYPGWKAFVDDTEVPWFPVDLVLRGVEVGTGTHTIRFEYRPRSIRWGAWVSLTALSGTLLLLASSFWKRPDRRTG